MSLSTPKLHRLQTAQRAQSCGAVGMHFKGSVADVSFDGGDQRPDPFGG